MFVVYDLETTGLRSLEDSVIEFAYIAYDDNKMPVKAERLYFYHKGMTWSEDAYKVHKIPLDFLKQHEDKFEENILKMYSILMNNVVVGYNNDAFDNIFSTNWLARFGLTGLVFKSSFDMMKVYRPVYKRSRCKLVKLCEMLQLTPDTINSAAQFTFQDDSGDSRAHEGGYDTMATAILMLKALNDGTISLKQASLPSCEAVNKVLDETTDWSDTSKPTVLITTSKAKYTYTYDFGSDEVPDPIELKNWLAHGNKYLVKRYEDGLEIRYYPKENELTMYTNQYEVSMKDLNIPEVLSQLKEIDNV